MMMAMIIVNNEVDKEKMWLRKKRKKRKRRRKRKRTLGQRKVRSIGRERVIVRGPLFSKPGAGVHTGSV